MWGHGGSLAFSAMPRYFFDTRDGELVRDEIGMELDGIAAARDEATRGLADFAHDALPGSVRRGSWQSRSATRPT